jgi:hypothetical protein
MVGMAVGGKSLGVDRLAYEYSVAVCAREHWFLTEYWVEMVEADQDAMRWRVQGKQQDVVQAWLRNRHVSKYVRE